MVQSLNTKVDLVADATSFMGLSEYGQVMVGDKAFEFYNSRDKNKYIQIPWTEIDYVEASVLLNGKWIPRYAINTKRNGQFMFASKQPKKVLRAMRDHLGPNKMFRALTSKQIIGRGLQNMKIEFEQRKNRKKK